MANVFSIEKRVVRAAVFTEKETAILDVFREDKTKEFGSDQGETIYIKSPSYPAISDGMTGTTQDVNFGEVSMTVSPFNTSISLAAIDEALKVEDYDEDIAKPAGVSVADYIEAKTVNECVNNAGTISVIAATPTFQNLSNLHAGVRILRMGRDMVGFIDPLVKSAVIGTGNNQFGLAKGEQMYSGEIGKFDKVPYFEHYTMPLFTMNNLPVAGTSKVTVAVTAQGATQLTIDGLVHATNPVAAGTVLELTGVNIPTVTGKDTGRKRQLIVTKTSAAAVANVATVEVAPIYFKEAAGTSNTTSARQNVTVESIAAGTVVSAVLTAAGKSYRLAIAIDRNTVAWASPMLPKYKDKPAVSSTSMKPNKIALRVGNFSNGTDGSQLVRLDGLFGVRAVTCKGIALMLVQQ